MTAPGSGRDLAGAVAAAVRASCAAIEAARPGEPLAGYALATDDGVETLAYLAVTAPALAARADPDLRFSPTDWPEPPGCAAVDAVDRWLRARAAAAPDLRAHVDDSFRLLVEVLADLKRDGVFPDDVFLSVLSTDPSDHLEELEAASVSRLNGPALVQARRAFLARWS
jgi:hypothetical protein